MVWVGLFLMQLRWIIKTSDPFIATVGSGNMQLKVAGSPSSVVEREAIMKSALRMAVCLFAVGCVKVEVQQMDQVVRPARSPDVVEVLVAEPEQHYIVIAKIESSFDGALKGFDDLRREMIAKAAELGGDALILGPESKKSGVIFVPTPIYYDRKKLTGEVIAFN
jgi:SepF-like predicted cell division protein (DUF552 family)